MSHGRVLCGFFLLKEIEREAKKLGMFANNALGVNRSGVIKFCNRLVKLLSQVKLHKTEDRTCLALLVM